MMLSSRLPAHLDAGRVLRAFEQQWNQNLGEWLDSASQVFTPASMRAWSHDGTAIVEFDLPGCSPDSVQLTVLRDELNVEVRPEESNDSGQFHVRERQTPSRREVKLPFVVDPQRTEAKCVNGVLRVTLHQIESDRPARIEVRGV